MAAPNEDRAARWRRLLVLLVLLLLIAAGGGSLELPVLRVQYHLRAARAAQQRRDFALARSHLLASLAADAQSAHTHFLLARVERQAGAFEDAEEELNACQGLEGPSPRLALERALLQAAQGAITQLNERQLQEYVAGGHPDGLQILDALSVGCLISYRFSSAQGYLSEWIDRDPENYQPYVWRSLANERIEDFRAALDDARQAVRLAPDRYETQRRLGESLLLNAGHAEAASLFTRLHQQRATDPVAALGLARALAGLSQIDEAVPVLDDLLTRFPNDTGALLERGRLALQRNEVDRAEAWLLRAARLAPADYEVQYALLQCHRQQGKDTRETEQKVQQLRQDQLRLQQLERRLRQERYNLAIRCEIARLCLEQENAKEAVQWLKSALKIDPGHRLANEMLIAYYEKSGQPALAAPYRAAVASAPR